MYVAKRNQSRRTFGWGEKYIKGVDSCKSVLVWCICWTKWQLKDEEELSQSWVPTVCVHFTITHELLQGAGEEAEGQTLYTASTVWWVDIHSFKSLYFPFLIVGQLDEIASFNFTVMQLFGGRVFYLLLLSLWGCPSQELYLSFGQPLTGSGSQDL